MHVKYLSQNLFFFFFWLHRMACGILVPRTGIEPAPLAVRAQSPNHWTAREFPYLLFICLFVCLFVLAASGLSCGTQDLSFWHASSSLRYSGFSLVVVRGLASCGPWAQLPHGMWDLRSLTRDQTSVPCITRWILNQWTTRKIPPLPIFKEHNYN